MKQGIRYMLISVASFALMGLCVKKGLVQANHSQALLLRCVFGIPFIMLLALRSRTNLVQWPSLGLIWRCVVGFASMFLYFYALSKIPFGNASILHATSPIFVALLSQPLAKERTSKNIFILLPFFLIGVGMVVEPTWNWPVTPSIAALLAGLLAAIAHIFVRNLRNEHGASFIVFYFTLSCAIFVSPVALTHWNSLNMQTTLWLMGSGIASVLGQLFMTKAYQFERVSLLTLYSYGGPVLAYLIGLMVFHEQPRVMATLGTILIIFCGVIASRLRDEPGNTNPLQDS